MPNSSEQGTGLAPNCKVTCSGNRLHLMQRLAGELCIESWQKKKKNSYSLSFYSFTLKRFIIYFLLQSRRSISGGNFSFSTLPGIITSSHIQKGDLV